MSNTEIRNRRNIRRHGQQNENTLPCRLNKGTKLPVGYTDRHKLMKTHRKTLIIM